MDFEEEDLELRELLAFARSSSKGGGKAAPYRSKRDEPAEDWFMLDPDMGGRPGEQPIGHSSNHDELTDGASYFQWLLYQGLDLSDPESLDDERINQRIWEIVDKLSDRNVYLQHTDHLSDRALYEKLWHEVLHEIPDQDPEEEGQPVFLTLLQLDDEEDVNTFLTYFADEFERRNFNEDFPELDLPDHEEPPFDRDARLPVPHGQ